MPASASRVCGRRGRHLDQRAVGEDHVGGHALRRRRARGASPSARRAGPRPPRRPAPAAWSATAPRAAWRTLSARSSRLASPRSSGRAASVRRRAPWRSGSGRTRSRPRSWRKIACHSALERSGADAEGRQALVAAAQHLLAALAAQDGDQVLGAEALAGAEDRREGLARRPRWRRRASGRSRQRSQLPQGSARVSPK